jgi:hypothetical protein
MTRANAKSPYAGDTRIVPDFFNYFNKIWFQKIIQKRATAFLVKDPTYRNARELSY